MQTTRMCRRTRRSSRELLKFPHLALIYKIGPLVGHTVILTITVASGREMGAHQPFSFVLYSMTETNGIKHASTITRVKAGGFAMLP